MSWPRTFNIHVCAWEKSCFAPGLWRLEIHTPWWHWGVALRPRSRYFRGGSGRPLTRHWTSLGRPS